MLGYRAAVATVLAFSLFPALPIGAATTAEQLTPLRAQIAAVQREADQYTAQYGDALALSAILHDEIVATSQSLRSREARVRTMRVARLSRALREEQAIVAQSAAIATRINQQLVSLEQLRQLLERQQEAERAEQRARGRLEAIAARRAQSATAGLLPSGSNEGVAVCPIWGPVSFTDTWHAPRPGGRLHEGVDLMAPFGTPDVAVTSGRIEHNSGPNEGNGIFLYGDNGNTYYYFHLSSYAGGPRHVQTGEVIGYVGATGDTTANHTHFEIHPGGGAPIDPYPAARSVC